MPPWTSSLQTTSRFLTHRLWGTQWDIFICVCVCTYAYTYTHVHMHIYTYRHTHICIYTYTYVMKGNSSHVHGGWEAPPCAACRLRPEGGARQFGLKAREPAERKVWTLAGAGEAERAGSEHQWAGVTGPSTFCPSGASADWMLPTHNRRGPGLYWVHLFKC